MRIWIVAAAAFAAFDSAPAGAGDPWVTLRDGDQEQVVELRAQGSITVLKHHSTAVFGESPTQIAIAAYDTASRQYQLRIIDKHARQVRASWPLPLTPVRQLSGTAPDVVLLDDVAYVMTHAWSLAPGETLERNASGGTFNIVRITLRTGEIRVLPLKDTFANPRLANFDGVPVVMDWAGYSVARLSAHGEEMISVIARDELFSMLPDERAERQRRTLPFSARADYVAVPGAGIFRMSKFGVLQRVADARLAALTAPFASLPLGPAQFNERLLAATSSKGPAIAIVRNEQGRRTLVFVDARTLTESWRRELPPDVSPPSLAAGGPDAVVGIDAEKGALVRVSREDIEELRKLPAAESFGGSRILSAGAP